jgi:hypothetical protein
MFRGCADVPLLRRLAAAWDFQGVLLVDPVVHAEAPRRVRAALLLIRQVGVLPLGDNVTAILLYDKRQADPDMAPDEYSA